MNARVRQREQRHDEEPDPRVQGVFEPLQRRHTLLRGEREQLQVFHHHIVSRSGGELRLQVGNGQPQRLAPHPHFRRGKQTEHDARDRRVNAGLVYRQPDERAHEYVHRRRAHADLSEDAHEGEPGRREQQHEPVQPGAVERGDHDHRADVVGDRQRQQHDLQSERHALAQHGHDADDERDVGRHRDAPPAERRFPELPRLEQHVDSGRDKHPAQRRGHRQRGLASVPQFARHKFAFDFQPDDEKEDRHQHIVDDEVTEFPAEFDRADFEMNGRVPELVVRIRRGRVRQGEREDDADEQHDAAGGFDLEVARERARKPRDGRHRQVRVRVSCGVSHALQGAVEWTV